MRRFTSLVLIIPVFILLGCADRNAPVTPSGEPELVLVGEVKTPGLALDLFVCGDSLFVADDMIGATIWNISDIHHPQLVYTYKTASRVKHLAWAPLNRILFTIQTDWIVGYQFKPDTIQEMFNPMEIGTFAIHIYELSIDTVIVAITDPMEGHYVYRTYPSDDTLDFPYWVKSGTALKSIRGSHRGFYMDIEDSTEYLANDQLGLKIARIKVVGGYELTPISSIDTYGEAYDVTLNGDKTHAIVADYAGGIQIFNVTDKTNPRWVGSLIPDKAADVDKVYAVGDTVYFIDRYDGLFAADIRDPEHPVLIGCYPAPAPTGLYVRQDHTIILTDEDRGILIFTWSNP
jgi:hypothetical protein